MRLFVTMTIVLFQFIEMFTMSQEMAVTTSAAASTTKEEDDEASDKGSESDEGETNKDSPSERDEESDKQSDTEVDEGGGGDDEEVSVTLLSTLNKRTWACLQLNVVSSNLSGVGGAAAEHPAARAGAAGNEVEGDAPRLQPLLSRGEAGVVVAVHRRPQRSDARLHALPRLHTKRLRGGETVLLKRCCGKSAHFPLTTIFSIGAMFSK